MHSISTLFHFDTESHVDQLTTKLQNMQIAPRSLELSTSCGTFEGTKASSSEPESSRSILQRFPHEVLSVISSFLSFDNIMRLSSLSIQFRTSMPHLFVCNTDAISRIVKIGCKEFPQYELTFAGLYQETGSAHIHTVQESSRFPSIAKLCKLVLEKYGHRIVNLWLQSAIIPENFFETLSTVVGCRQLRSVNLSNIYYLNSNHLRPLQYFSKIEMLDLSGSSADDQAIVQLQSLACLTSLRLLNLMKVTDASVLRIQEWTQLRDLALGNNDRSASRFSETAMQSLFTIVTQLRSLEICTRSGISSDVFAAIVKISSLARLHLHAFRQLEKADFYKLQQLPTLTDLSVEGCVNFDTHALQTVAAIPTLQQIYLDSNHVGTLESLITATRLHTLAIGNLNNMNQGLKPLAHLTSLTELSISSMSFQGWRLKHLKSLTHLTSLKLHSLNEVTEDHFTLIGHMTPLVQLTISNCHHFKSAALSHLCTRLEKLRALCLSSLSELDDVAIRNLGNLTNLEILSILNCKLVQGRFFNELQSIPLKSLHLSLTRDFTDSIFTNLQNFSTLETVTLQPLRSLDHDMLRNLKEGPRSFSLSIK